GDGEFCGQAGDVVDLPGGISADAGVRRAGGRPATALLDVLPAVHQRHAAYDVHGRELAGDGVIDVRHRVRHDVGGDHRAVGKPDRGGHAAVRAAARVGVAPEPQDVVEAVVLHVDHP